MLRFFIGVLNPLDRSIDFPKKLKKRHDYTDYRYTLWLWRLKLHFKMMKYIKIGAGQFFKYCSWTIFATKLISTLRAQLIILKQYDSNYENNFPSVHICQILYELWFLNLIAFSLNNRWLFKKKTSIAAKRQTKYIECWMKRYICIINTMYSDWFIFY